MFTNSTRSRCIDNKVLYDVHIKDFLNMVKGLLALVGLVFKVFKSFSFLFSNNFVKYRIYSSQKKHQEKNKAIVKQKNQIAQKMSTYFCEILG